MSYGNYDTRTSLQKFLSFKWLGNTLAGGGTVLAVIAVIAIVLGVIGLIFCIGPLIFMWAWNLVLPVYFGLPVMTFWPAVGCVLLLSFLTGGRTVVHSKDQ